MTNKITLITPPDIYENSNHSLLFIGLTDEDQDAASLWLGQNDTYPETNFYYYQGEDNLTWLLYALARADAVFLNFESNNAIINIIGSYVLSRPGVHYTTKDENLKALMSHINNQYVSDVTVFLEKVFNEQRS
jgi:hypothetical protein